MGVSLPGAVLTVALRRWAGLALAGALAAAAGAAPARDELTLYTAGGHALQVELADTPAERARGLMFRRAMDPDRGMLFAFGSAGHWPFWMKNTLLALDIIWIRGDGRVVHVAHDVPVCPAGAQCPVYASPHEAEYVLELNAGRARALGITPGQRLDLAALRDRP